MSSHYFFAYRVPKAPRKSLAAGRESTTTIPESVINYSNEQVVSLVFSNCGETATTHVAPMDIADVRTILLSKQHNFPCDAMKVFGPDGKVMEVRAWVELKKDMWLEKWRQNSTWFGGDGEHHPMSGTRCTLEFMAVVPYYGPSEFATALRALVPGLIQETNNTLAAEKIVNYTHETEVSLSFTNGDDTIVAMVAPMDIADVKTVLLSKTHTFACDIMRVIGPDDVVMKVRDWVELNKEGMWLEKWRQNSTWLGSDQTHHQMSGPKCTLQFLAVVPIYGPQLLVSALRALIPSLLIEQHRK